MFIHGDIVKQRFAKSVEYFIVTDMADFSQNGDGSEMVYEVMRIYPITLTSKIANFDEKQLELIGKGNEKQGRMMLDYVIKERLKRGWRDEPDFLIAMSQNLKANKLNKAIPPKLDEIRYDKLPNIDSCLDAMNDLERLYELFGDEAFLQLREVVKSRLKQLID